MIYVQSVNEAPTELRKLAKIIKQTKLKRLSFTEVDLVSVRPCFTQWTFWYCNDVGVSSPSILLWHCWYIVNEIPDDVNLRDINLTSTSCDWTNQTLMSSWHRHNNGRYPAHRNPPGSYTSSVSATKMQPLYCGNWKIRATGTFFQLLLRKTWFFSYQCYSTLYLLRKSFYNVIILNPDVYYPFVKIRSWGPPEDILS